MTAAELLVQVATRFWQAMGYALPGLPQNLQAALSWRVDDADMRWTMSLLLAGWRLTDVREPRAAEVSQLLRQMGASWVIGQINNIRSIEGMEQFADRARDADSEAKIKAAGISLRTAIERLDTLRMLALIEMLRRTEVREVGQQLVRRFPRPDSQRPSVYGNPPTAPSTPSSRGALFDRADYAPRDRALFRPTESVPRSLAMQEEPTPIPSPVLDEQAMTTAYLHTLGFSEEQVQRLISGPGRKIT